MGLFGKKEPAEIVELKKKSKAGDAEAKFQLHKRYSVGDGVEKDDPMGGKMLMEAADLGHVEAQFLLGGAYKNLKKLEEAVHWYAKAAEQGHIGAMASLGNVFHDHKVHDKAFKYFLAAAERGEVVSQLNVGVYYAKGWGVKIDAEKAMEWMKKSADQGYADAQAYLEKMKQVMEKVKAEEKAAASGSN
jgi:TPR repeat protein